jgi:hypothetical protein
VRAPGPFARLGAFSRLVNAAAQPYLAEKSRSRTRFARIAPSSMARSSVSMQTAAAGFCDLEGIVAKWSKGTYQCDGRGTSWLKVKNPEYSQIEGRHELFEANFLSGGAAARRLQHLHLALV